MTLSLEGFVPKTNITLSAPAAISPDRRLPVCELFRRLLLRRLHQQEHLSEELHGEPFSRYRTGDVCAILRVSPDLLRWRFMTGKYSEVGRDGWGRIFTLEDVKRLISQTRSLNDPMK